jgi:hypothetical protein
LRTIIYYDIFNYPLKENEIFAKLVYSNITTDNLHNALEFLVNEKILCFNKGFYLLTGKDSIVDRRLLMEHHAKWMWKIARIVTHLICKFPFVRGVFVSGSLSKGVTDSKSDIDFFVITKPERLWISRTSLVLFKKIFLFNRYKFFCTNYFISEDRLEIEDKNLFTAIEIAHLKPVYNVGLYNKFMEANSWIKSFLPNYTFIDKEGFNPISLNGNIMSRKVFELFLDNELGNKFDVWLMKKQEKYWEKKYKNLSYEKRDLLFRCRRYSSKVHGYDFQTVLLEKYNERLKGYNVEW